MIDSRPVKFTKMQSLGNDFVIIDATALPFHLSPEEIRKMGDRHFGVGFDQMMVLKKPKTSEVNFNYKIFNSDGSAAGQCGNGVRCLALYIRQHLLPNRSRIRLKIEDRMISAVFEKNGQVSISMGEPIFQDANIPFVPSKIKNTDSFFKQYEQGEMGVLSVGNPHAVILVSDVEKASVEVLGEEISHHPAFPEQVNVSFMQINDSKSISLRVYERGVGETLACGSAACAAVVMGRVWGKLDSSVDVALPGGELKIEWEGQGHSIQMTGGGEFVFWGDFNLS